MAKLVATVRHPVTSFGDGFRQFWRGFVPGLFDHYQPERHYMRGPGPKWRAKHAHGVIV